MASTVLGCPKKSYLHAPRSIIGSEPYRPLEDRRDRIAARLKATTPLSGPLFEPRHTADVLRLAIRGSDEGSGRLAVQFQMTNAENQLRAILGRAASAPVAHGIAWDVE